MKYSEIKLVETKLEGDAVYAKLITQQFPMGAGYQLDAGMTHEIWYKELKLANRWLAAVVNAGELKPPDEKTLQKIKDMNKDNSEFVEPT